MNHTKHLGRLAHARGVTLVELMIAMVLGLVVVGGVTNIIVSSQQTYRANEGLAAIQESARTALELIAREIRESGSTPCGDVPVANVLNSNGANHWWGSNSDASWVQWRENGFRAYADTEAPGAAFGNTSASRVRPTPPAAELAADDAEAEAEEAEEAEEASPPAAAAPARIIASHAFQIRSTSGLSVTVSDHSSGGGSSSAASQFRTDSGTSAISDGDILMVCGLDHATVFQVTNYNASSRLIVANTGGTRQPGNCTKNLSYPVVDCGAAAGTATYHTFLPGSSISQAIVTTWYVGHNGRGSMSLYRVRIGRAAEEIIPDVVDMVMQVHVADGALVPISDALNWANVNAVQVTLSLRSPERGVATDTPAANDPNAGRFVRDFTTVIALRNRTP